MFLNMKLSSEYNIKALLRTFLTFEIEKEKKEMKITAGLGSIDEYIRFVKAGADEFFCGYVPYSWAKKYGTVMPLNRREVFCYNVQLGSYSELEILSAMIKRYGKPVHLTFNSLYYIPQQYPEIAEIIQNCMKLGFQSYIVADPALIIYLRNQGIDCDIHLSGEMGEINSRAVEILQRQKLKRIIFHRKNTFEDMEAVIRSERAAGGTRAQTEFEAFALNEMCQFSGAFCNSLHCDELGYLCRVPYQLKKIRNDYSYRMGDVCSNIQRNDMDKCITNNRMTENSLDHMVLNHIASNHMSGSAFHDCSGSDILQDGLESIDEEVEEADDWAERYDDTGYLCGETGCGLCALYQQQKAGITHLKLVGRGNYTDIMEKDIRNLKQALNILDAITKDKQTSFRETSNCTMPDSEHPTDNRIETEFIQQMKRTLFPKGCSGNCYYR